MIQLLRSIATPGNWLLIICLLACTVSACSADTDPGAISLGRPYVLAPAPNYLEYPPANVAHVLADGKYARGFNPLSHMWTSLDALTWQGEERITYTMDLGRSASIGAVTLHTAAGTSGGVRFPGRIFVYLSDDGTNYTFAGFMSNSVGANEIPAYVETTYSLVHIGHAARYVHLEILANPPFFTMDEIEVIPGRSAAALAPGIPISEVEQDVDRRNRQETASSYSKQDNNQLGGSGDKKTGEGPLDRRARMLMKQFPGQNLVVQTVSPWSTVSPMDIPSGSNSTDHFHVSIPLGECAYRAFTLTNASGQRLDATLSSTPSSGSFASDVFEALEVRDVNGVGSYDPLVRAADRLILEKGTSRFIMLRMCGRKVSDGSFELGVSTGGSKRFSLKADASIIDAGVPVSRMQGTSWGYLNKAQFNSDPSLAAEDLITHHQSAVVVPLASLGADPRSGLGRLDQYMSLFDAGERSGKATKVLLFLELRGTSVAQLSSSAWKTSFLAWYEGVRNVLEKHGWKRDAMYFYPYDEPASTEVANAEAFFQWFRATVPAGKTFSTIDTPAALALTAYVDISCIHRILIDKIGSISNNTWLYDTKGPSKSNAVYGYYRLLPWIALDRGMGGVGFWSYSGFADEGRPWDDFIGSGENYSPVYFDQQGTLRSSRRWEAWSAGLEDAALVELLEEKKGGASAHQFIQAVLNSKPGDPGDADNVRQKVIEALTR